MSATEITRTHHPKLPPLPAYADHVDRILTPPPRPPRLGFLWLPALPVLLALWVWPGYTLAVVCLGGPVALLGWFLWSCRAEGREHDEEQNIL